MKDNKVIVLYGARQVGKTTLIRELVKNTKHLWLNADEPDVLEKLQNKTSSELKTLTGDNTVVVIDEAQRIENVGLTLKLFTDELPGIKVIASGSSSFELSNKIKEPLTGRKWEFMLYPFSYSEMKNHTTAVEEKRLLEHRLIYGYYPDIVNHPGDAEFRLNELSESYLYKDILALGVVRKPDRLQKLLQALAFQVGNVVSYHELGQICGINNETVETYVDLLEKSFVVFHLGSFSRNLRNEIKKSRKIYFHDNGIRNSIIRQFNPVSLRNDIGALWENFIISERIKFNSVRQLRPNMYFWRTHSGQEIDYIEESGGELRAFEMKWSQRKKHKIPESFATTYPEHTFEIIDRMNFDTLIS
ncbi:MAG: ATP-binding protein [Leptospirales bacterium]